MLKRSAGVYKAEAIAPIYHAAKYRRVDAVRIGDSNELQSGIGNNHGQQYAFYTLKTPMYAPSMWSQFENQATGYSSGTLNNGSRTHDNTNTPAEFDSLLVDTVATLSGGQTNALAWYMNDSQTDGGQKACYVDEPVWNAAHSWKFHIQYGKFLTTDGAGDFRPWVRKVTTGPTYTFIAQDSSVSTCTEASTRVLAWHTFTMNAGAHSTGTTQLQFAQKDITGGNLVNGPYFGGFMRLEDADISNGWSVSTMIARGGQGLFEYMKCMNAGDAGLANWIQACVRHQVGNPMILFVIDSGLNDRNDDADLSLGPIGGLVSSSIAGFADNLDGIINKLTTIWGTTLGYDLRNLFFQIAVSNPVSNRDDVELVGYRQGAKRVCDRHANTAMIDKEAILNSYLQGNAAAWYATGGSDTNHLTTTGYEQTNLIELREIYRAVNL